MIERLKKEYTRRLRMIPFQGFFFNSFCSRDEYFKGNAR
jgi:hypothetical protein